MARPARSGLTLVRQCPHARMQGPFKTPESLAAALLRGAITPERITRLVWHARKGTRTEFARTLAALPEDTRAQVETVAARVRFAG